MRLEDCGAGAWSDLGTEQFDSIDVVVTWGWLEGQFDEMFCYVSFYVLFCLKLGSFL